jgi:hypothetical protein
MEKLYEYCVDLSTKVKSEPDLEQKQEEYKFQKYNKAYELAFKAMIDGAEEKIKESAQLGYTRTDIFSYRRSDNIKFNGVYLIDILRKSKDQEGDVMVRLREYFTPFQVYIKSFPSKNNDSRYVIYVSWYQQETQEENQ